MPDKLDARYLDHVDANYSKHCEYDELESLVKICISDLKKISS